MTTTQHVYQHVRHQARINPCMRSVISRRSSIFDFYDSIPLDPASNETNKNYNLIIVSLESCYLFNCFNCDLGLFSLSQSLCLDTRRRAADLSWAVSCRVKCLTPQVCLGLFVVYAWVTLKCFIYKLSIYLLVRSGSFLCKYFSTLLRLQLWLKKLK